MRKIYQLKHFILIGQVIYCNFFKNCNIKTNDLIVKNFNPQVEIYLRQISKPKFLSIIVTEENIDYMTDLIENYDCFFNVKILKEVICFTPIQIL